MKGSVVVERGRYHDTEGDAELGFNIPRLKTAESYHGGETPPPLSPVNST